jgi:hypothetical protein
MMDPLRVEGAPLINKDVITLRKWTLCSNTTLEPQHFHLEFKINLKETLCTSPAILNYGFSIIHNNFPKYRK